MDFGRILGAVLGGATQRPRARATRRGTGPLGMNQTQTRQAGRAIGTLATIAIEALSRPSAPAPRPYPQEPPQDPAGRRPPRRIPDVAPREPPARVELSASVETAESRLLLRAMIAAARADGAVDREERAAISRQLDAAGLTAAERDRVLADFDRPASIGELAAGARDPMLAAQLYAAAFGAAGELSPEERAWLDRLGVALKLDKAAIAAIEQRLGS
ncbi:DUF533 domain-containing protein [Roseococcus sp. SYP-B2431]|uniref:DUF533 domain-containing protein n=1 Tax=Roseococcus sp. SYP-B2431 TaxID=2496640 RepID=UPI001039FA33|nr:DUF533 domain-containing protein [Roseococcus sp. SYP-B2431]TCH97437.1 DUF533 domain-containing protein [Roseococcus sp. SYP-B2431]